ncbi:MAG TPA: tetratricopeptide repeat protein [Gemmatimonadales bacterium]|nr:tetratricopeptide repeat protein [Gemmatimonadales bacterium]
MGEAAADQVEEENVLALYFGLRPLDVYPKARRAITRALELDPAMAEAQAWLATLDYWFEFDWRSAEPRFQHALALDPDCSTAHDLYGCFLTAWGRHAEARCHYERACAFDPLSTLVAANAALGAYRARDYDRAIDLSHRVISLDPNLPLGHAVIALVYVQQGRCTQALNESAEAVRLGKAGSPWHAIHAYVAAACGEDAEARRLLQELEALRATESIWLFMVGMSYSKLGDSDLAFARLEGACRERGGWSVWLSVEPGLDDLRTDARFPLLVRQVGLAS